LRTWASGSQIILGNPWGLVRANLQEEIPR
jgi:hypothetical protein